MYKQNRNYGLVLWEKWVLATAISEVVGFSIVAAVSTLMQKAGNVNTYAILLLIGIVQGIVLGFSQSLVLRRYIEKPIGWVIVTTFAAFLAWVIGLAISISIALAFSFAGDKMKLWGLLQGVALLGGGVGAVLGCAQWLILRTYVRTSIRQAGWWIGANALAWALGSLIMFIGTGVEQLDGLSIYKGLITAATGAAVGAVIGGITGIVLVWLLKPRLRQD